MSPRQPAPRIHPPTYVPSGHCHDCPWLWASSPSSGIERHNLRPTRARENVPTTPLAVKERRARRHPAFVAEGYFGGAGCGTRPSIAAISGQRARSCFADLIVERHSVGLGLFRRSFCGVPALSPSCPVHRLSRLCGQQPEGGTVPRHRAKGGRVALSSYQSTDVGTVPLFAPGLCRGCPS
jgi:hypothetical protein